MELTHSVRRSRPEQLPDVALTLAKISTYEVDATVRHLASIIDAEMTVALHVATALIVLGDECQGFITYDPSTAKVATRHHLPVLAP